jgi:ABC-type transport system substrate-binding protein
MRKIIYLGLAMMAFFLIMPFAQVSASPQATTVPQKFPGQYISETSSLSHDPYDPATNYETLGGSIIQEVYEGLYDYAGNNMTGFRPILATSYTISPDGLNYTFTIRSGVTFTDGSPLNAYVFQYSIERAIIMNDPSSGIWILDQSVKNASWLGDMGDVNITQAATWASHMGVHANSATSLSILLDTPSAALIPELIFPAAYAVSPSWIIAHKPASYTMDGNNVTGMIPLWQMFPGVSNATILSMLGLPSTANPADSGVVPQAAHDDPQVGYKYFADNAMGTGPYMLTKETAGVSIQLTRNDNWWNKANFHKDASGTVNAPKEVFLKQVPETETRVLDMKNDNAHSAYIPSSNLGELINTTTHKPYGSNLNVYTFPTLTTAIMGFNENATIAAPGQIIQSNADNGYNYTKIHNASDPLLQYTWKNSTGGMQYASPANPFSALKFREAFAYAWDYQSYMNTILNGQAFRLSGVIPKGLFGHQDDLISSGIIPSQNLARAKSLFKEVGWKGTVTINYNSGNVERQKSAQLLASVISSLDIGISITIAEVQWSTFLSLNYEGGAAMFFLGWAPDYADASDYAVPFLHSGNLFATSMHYNNTYVDQYMDQADAMTVNNKAKNDLYRAMEVNASGDFPYIYLAQFNAVSIRNRWVVDWNSAYAGNENPMSWGTRYQFIGLAAYTPGTDTAVQTPTGPVNQTTTVTKATPGFEGVALVVSLTAVAALVTLRRRRN